jgi:hypothetical protein
VCTRNKLPTKEAAWPRPLFTVASTGNAFNQLLLLPLHSLQSQLVRFAEGKKKQFYFSKNIFSTVKNSRVQYPPRLKKPDGQTCSLSLYNM